MLNAGNAQNPEVLNEENYKIKPETGRNKELKFTFPLIYKCIV